MTTTHPLKAQLDQLFQQELSPEQFYRQYLGILMQAMQGMRGCHLWLLQGSQFVSLGGSDRAPILFETDAEQADFILAQIGACSNEQKTLFVAAGGGSANKCPFGLAFTPLLYGDGGGAVQGAQVSWWETGVGGTLNPQALEILKDCGRSAARMARIQKLESMSQISESLQLMARFLSEISAAPDLKSLAVTIVNRARELVACDRCALVIVPTPEALRVEAMSNVPMLDARSAVARTITQLAENAKNTGLPVGYRKANEKTEEKGDLSDYFYHSRMQEVLIAGIQPPHGELIGMLVFESENVGFFTPERHQTALSLAGHSGGALRRAVDQDLLPFRSLAEKIAHWRKLPPGEKKRLTRSRLWIPSVILLGILLFPVKYQFSGDVRLMPATRTLAVAQVPGRIVKILVEDGDPVVANQPIALLDDSEFRKQKEIAAQEEVRLMAETDNLTSQNERTAARISDLALQKARSEREYFEDQLARTVIRSPIAGVLMTPDLSSRQGDALPQGGQLALIGDPSTWELEILLPETDVAELAMRLQKGKPLTVRYILNSLPQKKFSTQISGLSALSAASEVVAGKNIFRVVAPLEANEEYRTLFRAGYTGRARLEIGRRPLGYTITRRFFNWLRTHVLF